MNYELCEKLKNIGFPQIGDYWIGEDNVTYRHEPSEQDAPYYIGINGARIKRSDEDLVRLPLLSELIALCQDYFGALVWCPDGWKAVTRSIAIVADEFATIPSMEREGNTPEEAVANLWLSLHKKEVS